MTSTSIAPKTALEPSTRNMIQISFEVSRDVENWRSGYSSRKPSTSTLTALAAPRVLMSASLLTMIVADLRPVELGKVLHSSVRVHHLGESSDTDHSALVRLRRSPRECRPRREASIHCGLVGRTAPCLNDPAGISAWKSARRLT